ncbi:MAG: NAD(+)/NADH kinase [Hyphomicrobiales bacterium]
MARGPIGIIANPQSGKDIRRLVAQASVFDNQEKRSIVRRAILGAAAAGASDFLFMPDPHRIVEDALDRLDADATFAAVDVPGTASAIDTTEAAAAMREAGAAVIITLGGDGTNRAVAKGWLDSPLIAISTGTNNVFPRMIEATVAGAAAGLVASGSVPLEAGSARAKRLRVAIEGEPDDLALIDVALVDERFVAARAVWMPQTLRTLVLSRANPAAVGLSAIGGLLRPVSRSEPGGLVVQCGEGGRPLMAPLAPGYYDDVCVRSADRLEEGEPVVLEGPGIMALDGEREIVLRPGQRAEVTVLRDGPHVVDVERVLQLAACNGHFWSDHGERDGN